MLKSKWLILRGFQANMYSLGQVPPTADDEEEIFCYLTLRYTMIWSELCISYYSFSRTAYNMPTQKRISTTAFHISAYK